MAQRNNTDVAKSTSHSLLNSLLKRPLEKKIVPSGSILIPISSLNTSVNSPIPARDGPHLMPSQSLPQREGSWHTAHVAKTSSQQNYTLLPASHNATSTSKVTPMQHHQIPVTARQSTPRFILPKGAPTSGNLSKSSVCDLASNASLKFQTKNVAGPLFIRDKGGNFVIVKQETLQMTDRNNISTQVSIGCTPIPEKSILEPCEHPAGSPQKTPTQDAQIPLVKNILPKVNTSIDISSAAINSSVVAKPQILVLNQHLRTVSGEKLKVHLGDSKKLKLVTFSDPNVVRTVESSTSYQSNTNVTKNLNTLNQLAVDDFNTGDPNVNLARPESTSSCADSVATEHADGEQLMKAGPQWFWETVCDNDRDEDSPKANDSGSMIDEKESKYSETWSQNEEMGHPVDEKDENLSKDHPRESIKIGFKFAKIGPDPIETERGIQSTSTTAEIRQSVDEAVFVDELKVEDDLTRENSDDGVKSLIRHKTTNMDVTPLKVTKSCIIRIEKCDAPSKKSQVCADDSGSRSKRSQSYSYGDDVSDVINEQESDGLIEQPCEKSKDVRVKALPKHLVSGCKMAVAASDSESDLSDFDGEDLQSGDTLLARIRKELEDAGRHSQDESKDENRALTQLRLRLRREGIGGDSSSDSVRSDSEEESDDDEIGRDDGDEPMEVEQDDDGWSPDIQPPQIPGFCPTRPPGPTRVMAQETGPADFFQLFFTDATIAHLCQETDHHARTKRRAEPRKHKGAWTCPTVEEMKAFLSLSMLMGIVRKPGSPKSYWSTSPLLESPIFGKTLPRDRYLAILRYLSVVSEGHNPNIGVGQQDPVYDRLWRIRWLMDVLNRRFSREFVPSVNVTVDKVMVPFKGKVRSKQYFHQKNATATALCDSSLGYMLQFDIYIGKRDNMEVNLAHRVTTDLLTRSGLNGQGYRLFCDSFYSSLALFTDLLENHGTVACGTVRKNCHGLPSSIMKKKPDGLGRERGSVVLRQKGQLTSLAWRDKRTVHVLSTAHDATNGEVTRTIKVNGRWTRKQFPSPQAVVDYTAYMGGVHLADQYCHFYLHNQKTCRWNIKVFFYMLEVAKFNAFRLFCASVNHRPNPPRKQLTFLEFSLKLVESFLATYDAPARQGRPSLQPLDRRLTARCMPGCFKKRSWCHVCARRVRAGTQDKRRQTAYGCLDCWKHLCIPECFTAYHTVQNY